MFIPLRHENMEGRRWPVISIALVVLNFGIFLATRGQIDAENPQRAEVRAHILLLAAMHREICRIFEEQRHYDRAVTEYDHLAQAYPTERQAILALLSAGRLSLKQLNRPGDALRYYNAAKASPVPHLDWEANIQAGIQAAEKAAGVPVGPA